MTSDGNNPLPTGKSGHSYRYWIVVFRRWITGLNPRIIEYVGYSGLLLLAIQTFFYPLNVHGIVNGNESLYVESAREMALTGEWAIPTLNGLPYLEKPPLFIWLITLAISLGTSIETPPRLAVAIVALLLTYGVVRFSVLLKVGTRGFAAGFILITTVGIDVMSRVAMPDITLTTLFALGCFSFLVALQSGKRGYLRLAAALMGAASLIKGPLAIALFALIVSTYYIIEPTQRTGMRKLLRDPMAAALMFLPLCVWLIAIEVKLSGSAYYFIMNEHVLRFLGKREPHDYYTGTVFYYVPRVFLAFFPWVGMLLFGWMGRSKAVDPAKRQIRRFLWLCVWIPFGFFTLSTAKANYYILICLPAMALLTADYLPNLLRERRRFHMAMAVTVPILILVLIGSFSVWQIRNGMTTPVVPVRDGSGAFTVGVLVSLALLALVLIHAGWRRQALLCVGGLILPLSFQFDHLADLAEPTMSSRRMANYIKRSHPDVPVYLYQDFETVGSLPIYLNRTLPVIDSKSNDLYFGRQMRPDYPNFVDASAVLKTGREALIVVTNDRLRAFEQSALIACASQLALFGRAALYRHACEKTSR